MARLANLARRAALSQRSLVRAPVGVSSRTVHSIRVSRALVAQPSARPNVALRAIAEPASSVDMDAMADNPIILTDEKVRVYTRALSQDCPAVNRRYGHTQTLHPVRSCNGCHRLCEPACRTSSSPGGT
jgi:hypothetical protein